MRRFALVLASVLFLAAGGPPEPPTCPPALDALLADIAAQQVDGVEARDALVARTRRFLADREREDSACTVEARAAQVTLLILNEDYDGAAASAATLTRSRAAQDAPATLARAYRSLGTALDRTGRFVEARQAYVAAAALVDRLPAATASATLRDLAGEAIKQGEWGLATEAHLRAMRILRDSLPNDPAGMRLRIGRLLVGDAYLLQQRLAQERAPELRSRLARRLVARADTADAIIRAHVSDDPAETAFDQGNRAVVMVDGAYGAALLGDHAGAAARLDAAERLLTDDVRTIHPDLASSLWLRRAETLSMAGRPAEAAQAAARALPECDAAGEVPCRAAILEQTAQIAESRGRLDDANRAYRDAVALRDIDWERGRLQDWNAGAFAEAQTPYRGLARVLVRQGQPAEAFAVLDGARARALRDMRARLGSRLPPARRARVDSLLDAVRAERVAGLGGGGTPQEQAGRTIRISRLLDDVDRATRQDRPPAAALDVGRLRQTLRAQNRTLVSFLVGEAETVAFVVTADTLAARVLPTGRADIERLMRAASGPWGGDAAVRLGPLHALHERLVRPLSDLLPAAGGLVVIPDGPLADLPFATLVEAPAADYATARFLVRSRPVSTDLAAALVVADAEQPAADFPVALAAFGRGRFDGDAGALRGRRGPVLANLPNVASEIARVRAHVGNHRAVLDADATEAQFNATAGQARVVHVASHAEADPAFPLHSRIYLWDDPDADDDGVVHLFEMQALRLPADLVVLSGCSTAAGQAQAGEGTIGLQYGVRAAGARAALATLWPVDDRATAEIVDTFYRGLAAGLPKDVALQQAQVAYLDANAGEAASPYYWAAAVLSGSPAPVPIPAPAPVWPWGVGAAVLAAGAGGLVWRSRRRDAR